MKKMLVIAWAVACTQGASYAQTSAYDPDVKPTDWVRANADTGRHLRGHIDILKAESRDNAGQAPSEKAGQQLTPAHAMQLALAARPELFASATLNAFERTQANARVLQLSHRVNRAWIDAVSAGQNLTYLRDVHEATQTAVELARRMASVGNWSKAQMMQEQRVLSDATVQLTQAQQQAFGARENLIRLLGLSGVAAEFSLPAKLPELPALLLPERDIEAAALQNKPELLLARQSAQMDLKGIRPQDMQRWTQASEAALNAPPQSTTTSASPDAKPMTLLTQAPVLNLRLAGLSEAVERAAHSQAAVNALAATTRSLAREAYFRYRTAHELARHQRDEGVRLNTALQEETQARYNGMLLSTWDLLASARARVQSVNTALQAQRDFWLAHTDLQWVMAGGEPRFTADAADTDAGASTPKGH